MKYNPKIHNRRSIRLQGYDYSHAGTYFITCCCHDRKCWFGKIEDGDMVLNEYGMGSIQRNFYDHIIRNEKSYQTIPIHY